MGTQNTPSSLENSAEYYTAMPNMQFYKSDRERGCQPFLMINTVAGIYFVLQYVRLINPKLFANFISYRIPPSLQSD